ncbi:putative membrane protein [Gottschalkia acidurici 9a]|uniref:TVP38/TMEM64 family membrane protein n=1 Tax=Gottschalkia acidurici (strain ATCC 7906 / DSM 604 / BCRC 14475 / CIP 104303 / KCTC 5404 / NCIMB 10678 / 9a) TaxID=1128398 RepID=K0B378_GOTA9|nr:TVP38/TMEM64 family protein [Gottschalkia acidurici]AFS79632.1 putative membrane protein [Gottschalkia acidurici 9a]
MSEIKKNKLILKYTIIVILTLGIIYGLNKVNVLKGYGANEIKDYINSFGILSPIVYVALLTLLPLLLFPDSVLVIAGGMVFGLVKGTILTSIGSFLGATVSFYISRILGQKIVSKFIKGKSVNLEKYSEQGGLFIILMLRLIPLFPFKVVSYSAGLSNIRFKDFTIATVIGSIPGIIVYTNLGDKSMNIGSNGFYISICLVILLFALSFVLKKKFSMKN